MMTLARPMTMAAAAHIDVCASLVLRQQAAGKAHKTIGEDQSDDLHRVGIHTLGAYHFAVVARCADGAAKFRAENQYITATTAAATSTPMSNAMGMFPRLMTTGWRRSATLDLPMMRRLME